MPAGNFPGGGQQVGKMKDVNGLMLPHIRRLTTYEGVEPTEVMAQRAGIPADKVIRLNGNENPYGPSPGVEEALGAFPNFNHYPDPEQRKLREVLADYLEAPAERIVAGNGSDEMIDLLMRMFVGPGENIVIPSPTFGMYAFSVEICGGETVPVETDENFEIDVEAMRRAVTPKTKAFFFASPNNPTGNIATEAQVLGLLETGLLVVVDETYYEFCGHTVLPLLPEHPNLVVLRTFSKWAGLAGLRIGLGIMNPDLARAMMAMKPPYNVNLAAEVALLASLQDVPGLLGRVRSIVAERDREMGLLREIKGLKVWPSQANFILIQLPEGKGKDIFEGLCDRGIFLRYFSTSRLKDHVRASVGLPHENDAVVRAFAELVEG
jgi:histidinol-phosphate aminotransferase